MAVHELPQLRVEPVAVLGEADEVPRQRVPPRVERVGARNPGHAEPPLDAGPRALDQVRRERGDHSPDERSTPRRRVVAVPARRAHAARDRELLDRGLLGQRQPVLEVVRLLGDLVGPVDGLRLECPARTEAQPLDEIERKRKVLRPRRVLQHPLAHVVREVQPRLFVALLEPVHDPHRLVVVLEAAGLRVALAQQAVEHVFPGVAERRVAEVVAERDRLGQVLVQAECPRDAARDLRDLDRVGQARPEVVALVRDEDLRLVLQAAEGARVDDPVSVARVVRPGVARARGDGPPRALGARAARRVDRQALFLEPLEVLPRVGCDDGRHGLRCLLLSGIRREPFSPLVGRRRAAPQSDGSRERASPTR